MSSGTTIYELAGGAKGFEALVTAFYECVSQNPDLSPLFPQDFTEIRQKQYEFLTQFFGGPALYSERRGAPMLRARHMPFPITPKRVEAWLGCMSQAMHTVGLDGQLRDFMFERLTLTAHHMMNTPEPGEELPRPLLIKPDERKGPPGNRSAKV